MREVSIHKNNAREIKIFSAHYVGNGLHPKKKACKLRFKKELIEVYPIALIQFCLISAPPSTSNTHSNISSPSLTATSSMHQ